MLICKGKIDMEYVIMDDYGIKELYIEYGPGTCAHYIKHRNEWVDGGWDLMDARVGFDESEPEGSPYRFGNGSCMHDIVQITKEEAEAIVGSSIDPEKIKLEIYKK